MASNRPEFDIAIIGAGPAGASAAISALRSGAKVVLFEAGEFPRHKVCGEFVSAESLDVLRDLVRDLPGAERRLASAPAIVSVRLLLGHRAVTARVVPRALSLPRYDLDLLLWKAAQQAGVQTRSACDVRDLSGDGPFRLDTSAGTIEAAAVIVAAGRWSRFTTRGPVPEGPKWIGLKAHYREAQPPSSTDLYFFDHGYCGVQPVADELVNACAMVRSDRATSLQEVFTLHPGLFERSRSWQPVTQSVTTAPLIYRTPRPVSGNRIIVGDAAAFIDPFVGDGISIALRTGQLAARALQPFLKGAASLVAAVTGYKTKYEEQFLPTITTASRIRAILSWPRPAQLAAFELLRLPGVMPYIIRRTRQTDQATR